MKTKFILFLLYATVLGAWAQTDFGNVPETVNASDATITKMGHLTFLKNHKMFVCVSL